MTTPFKASLRPDVLLRKYAHFEDPAPAPEPPPAPAPQSVTFTPEQQEAINKMVGKARTEGKQAGLTDFLKKVGAEKPEDVETGYKAHVQKVEGEKTEAQKAIDAAVKEKERADKAEKALVDRNAEIEAEKHTEKRNGALTKALTDPKTHSLMAIPEDVVLWAETNAADLLAKVLKEDGSVDDPSVAALVKKCREARPKWFPAPGMGSPSNQGGRAPQGERPQIKTSGHL